VAGPRDIHRVLGEDNRVVVGECDGLAAELPRRFGDGLGSSRIGQAVEFTGFANVPVLAKAAAQVATGCTKGKDASARIKMIERLFSIGSMQKPLLRP
jgi:hypothetical protein